MWMPLLKWVERILISNPFYLETNQDRSIASIQRATPTKESLVQTKWTLRGTHFLGLRFVDRWSPLDGILAAPPEHGVVNGSRGVGLTFDLWAVLEIADDLPSIAETAFDSMADTETADMEMAGGRGSWQFAMRRLFSNSWMFASNISFKRAIQCEWAVQR